MKKETIKKLSAKQRNVVEGVVQNLVEKGGKSKGQILKDAGYSPAIQKTPEKVFGSKKILQALDDIGIDDSFLALKQKSHLNARKIEIKDTFIEWGEYQENPKGIREQIEDELEEDLPGSRIVRIMERSTRSGESFVSVKFSYPDYGVQDKAIDKLYKLRGDYAPVKQEHSIVDGLASLFSDDE